MSAGTPAPSPRPGIFSGSCSPASRGPSATGHPSRIMDGSFANQVLAQIYLYEKKFALVNDEEVKRDLIKIEILPKKLDEEVATYMVEGFGGTVTKLSKEQADYINVSQEGPFKTEIYKY